MSRLGGCAFSLAFVLLLVGLFLADMTYTDYRLAAGATAEPEEIRLEDLIARGPEGNPHVVVTDYALCDNFVYSEPKDPQPRPLWLKVWVPIVPRGTAKGEPGQRLAPQRVQAIIFSMRIENQEALPRLAGPRLQGMVTNRIDSVGWQEQNLLTKSYPKTDFSRWLIIQDGLEPASRKTMLVQGAAAAVCLALAAGLIGASVFQSWRSRRPKAAVRQQPSGAQPSEENWS